MVRVDSSATFSSSSLVTSTNVSVSTLNPLTISSLATSSPVSASTFEYLIRWPVFRFSWLKEIFSDSEVAGYSATGHVTSERRRKPFQFARGAMDAVLHMRGGSDSRRTASLGSDSLRPSDVKIFRLTDPAVQLGPPTLGQAVQVRIVKIS